MGTRPNQREIDAGGRYIAKLREAQGLTNIELAKKIRVTAGAISGIEKGRTVLAQERYEALAVALGVDKTAFARKILWYQHRGLYKLLFNSIEEPK